MTKDPLPPNDPPPGGLPDDPAGELPYDALAAGELEEAEAQALRRRIASDPGAAELHAQAEAVERMLRAEPLEPLPLALVGRILAATAPRRARPHVVLARVAASVLVFLASWVALSGDLPALGDMTTAHPRLVASLGDTPIPAPPGVGVALPATEAGFQGPLATLAVSLAGLLLLVGGTVFALRSHAAAARTEGPPPPARGGVS